jgi:hypothetical protein
LEFEYGAGWSRQGPRKLRQIRTQLGGTAADASDPIGISPYDGLQNETHSGGCRRSRNREAGGIIGEVYK